jgi:hypothetical protein
MPAFGPGDITLNENQRRHLSVVLTLLEEALVEIEDTAASAGTPRGALTEYADDLPPGFAERAAPRIASLRRSIAEMVEGLGLTAGVISRRGIVRAITSAEAVRIEDSTARQLRGFGTVDPRFDATIQPLLDAMHAELKAIGRLASGKEG